MEFWGVEVKAGQSLVVKPGNEKYLHMTQATLGELKKDKANECITVFLKIGGQKLVLGILSPKKFPNLSLDLAFEKEFELSHNGENGSVYCSGFQEYGRYEEDEGHVEYYFGSQGMLPLRPADNGRPSHRVEEKSIAEAIKQEDEDSEDEDSEDEDFEDDVDVVGFDSSDTNDEDDGSESVEETPKKVNSAQKRLNESASKTHVPPKKARSASPEKNDGKKGGHTATPHPAKKPLKTPATAGKSKIKTPNGGQFYCKTCYRSFGSDNAIKSHNKAKHGGK